MKGGFKNEVIQYLIVVTNKGRESHFGKVMIEEECDAFLFKGEKGEYLGAFFGETCEDGINRIGCLIEHEK
jgi:hypothetical protein